MGCYRVCPQPQVIKPVLKGMGKNTSPLISAPACTDCGRCMDVCRKEVFQFTNRFAEQAVRLNLKELET